jgi:tRNA threonylcarbamoyladenosine biosynthesis protein TsaB
MVGLAVHDGSQVLAESIWTGGGRQTVELAPEVGLTLRRVGVAPGALTAVAVAIGPGSYTGLRVGLALAKGLALAHRLPVVGIPTLDILARGQPRRDEPMLALLQVGRGRLAGVWYKWKANAWQATCEIGAIDWEELLEGLEGPTYICGEIDGEARTRAQAVGGGRARLAPPWLCLRRPSCLAELAWEKVRAGKAADPAALVPLYLTGTREQAA